MSCSKKIKIIWQVCALKGSLRLEALLLCLLKCRKTVPNEHSRVFNCLGDILCVPQEVICLIHTWQWTDD